MKTEARNQLLTNVKGKSGLLLTLIPFGNPLNYRKFGQLVHKHFQHS